VSSSLCCCWDYTSAADLPRRDAAVDGIAICWPAASAPCAQLRPEQVKKGADQGVDGRLFLHVLPYEDTYQVVLSVKGGQHIGPEFVRDLAGTVGRQPGEQIGVLITLAEPTPAMRDDAAGHGVYTTPWGKHPRIQILTVADLLSSKRIDMPPPSQVGLTFKRAPKATREASHVQPSLMVGES
jgi:hypothetical protein